MRSILFRDYTRDSCLGQHVIHSEESSPPPLSNLVEHKIYIPLFCKDKKKTILLRVSSGLFVYIYLVWADVYNSAQMAHI